MAIATAIAIAIAALSKLCTIAQAIPISPPQLLNYTIKSEKENRLV